LAAALVAACTGLLAPACAENESSLFIRACVPKTFTEEAGCSATPDGDVFLGTGNLDLVFQTSYSCSLLIGNQVVERGSSDQLRTETSRITLYAADVRLTDLAGASLSYSDGSAAEFSTPISGFVDPGSGSDAGYGIAEVLLIDAGGAEAIGASVAASGTTDILANVIVYGRTLGGQELETPEWAFPVRVCIGCACSTPADDDCNLPTKNPEPVCSTDQFNDCRVGYGITLTDASGNILRDCASRVQAASAAF
jgi:hypothetical protein